MSRYRLVVTKSAVRDVRESFAYLHRRSPNVAEQFAGEVREALDNLSEAAHEFGIWRGVLRRMPLRRFPHGLLYELLNDEVIVVAVAHPRRNPANWTPR